MKDTNKTFLAADKFNDRVTRVLEARGITIEYLYDALVNRIGYDITRNNFNLYLKRVPNVNFLIALSKALGVSSDYLLGISNESEFDSGLCFKYTSPRYTKYLSNDYHVYFFATVNSEGSKLIEANLSIKFDSFYKVEMNIPLENGISKQYEGELIVSDTYKISYITLRGLNFGEMVHMSFIDPALNTENAKFQLAVGTMSSVSGGGLSRLPVMSRFIISSKKILDNKLDMIRANLKLNSKYINIDPEELQCAIYENIFPREKADNVLTRIQQAFPKKEYHSIIESFLIDTIKSDFRLTNEEINKILIVLRKNAICDSLAKINKSLDTRIYEYVNADDNSF